MARPEAWRLDPASYPHRAVIQTRFQDLDPLGHINNVAMAGLFETARVRFNRAMGLAGWHGHRWLVANITLNYLAESYFPEDLEVATGIGQVGTRSWQILSAGFQKDECVATCDAVIVMSGGGGATALAEDFRAGLEANRVIRIGA
ncbi:acyl-CoA thioesterase [Caulobacter sp.]|uniref:acyl-CoA thioesterase n=1 Tax=Caulobacter sp. TaxID=78 RepID=UPI003BAE308E